MREKQLKYLKVIQDSVKKGLMSKKEYNKRIKDFRKSYKVK